MKIAKIKFLGMAVVTAFFIFSVSSCSQSDNNKSAATTSTPDAGAVTTAKAEQLSGPQTIKGEVLDLSCYMDHDAMGDSHQKCAQGCLDKGLPAGILAENGQVYLLLEDHDLADVYQNTLKHAAEKVTISGTVINKNGVQSLIVKELNPAS